MVLNLDNELCSGVLFGLHKILAERGNDIATLARNGADILIYIPRNVNSMRSRNAAIGVARAMNDHQRVVCRHADITLRAIDAQLLGIQQARDGVSGRALLCVKTAVCNNLSLSRERERSQRCYGSKNQLFHSISYFA